MSETEKDHIALLAILEAIEKIQKISAPIKSPEKLEADFIAFDACLMNFIVIGEMVLRLSDTLMGKYKEVEWYKIKGFRNMVAHDYFGIDAEKVWDIIQTKLPELKAKANQIKYSSPEAFSSPEPIKSSPP
jgi:uncharacterized protein with HEPN domain